MSHSITSIAGATGYRRTAKSAIVRIAQTGAACWIMIAILMLSATTASGNGPLGLWETEDARSHIEIAPCGQHLCGTVRKLLDSSGMDAGMGIDDQNPQPHLRNRPIVGVAILTNLARFGGEWRGRAYNPDDGKVYDISIRMKGAKLEVTGCVLGIFCQSELWSRLH